MAKLNAFIALFLYSIFISTQTVLGMASVTVPERMFLNASMKAANIGKAVLTALNIDTSAKTVELGNQANAKDVIQSHTGKHGSVCFVVRRPGWVLCREQGLQLSQLAAQADKPLHGFQLFGIIKETGVDDEGLVDFYADSYTHPLYKDEEKVFYNEFFGERKLGLTTYNPFRLYRGFKAIGKRMSEKGLAGNMKGEGLVQGGIIILGKDGKAKFAYEEETGKEIPIDDIMAAINSVKGGKGGEL